MVWLWIFLWWLSATPVVLYLLWDSVNPKTLLDFIKVFLTLCVGSIIGPLWYVFIMFFVFCSWADNVIIRK